MARTDVPPWSAGSWVTATFRAEHFVLTLELRNANGESLGLDGVWRAGNHVALRTADTSVTGPGQAGLGRPAGSSGRVLIDDFRVMAAEPVEQTFDAVPAGGLPAAWSAWGSDTIARPQAASSGAASGQAVQFAGQSGASGRAWANEELPSDVTVQASVRVDTLVPAVVFARGRNLNTAAPTNYAASVVRGTVVKLLRVTDGNATQLAAVKTAAYLSQVRLTVSLTTQGNHQQVRVQRTDTGQWLTSKGDWTTEAVVALAAEDRKVSGPGLVGIGRNAGAAGSVLWDDFSARPADGDATPPTVNARLTPRNTPTPAGTLAGLVRFQAQVRDAGGIARVEFFVDGETVARRTAAPYRHDFDSRNLANGVHTLTVRAWDAAGNVGESSRRFTVSNRPPKAPPVPRHYSHIRYAALAYTGNPMGPIEQELLRESVDLVVPNERYLAPINAVARDTPQLIYSNISNLYLDSADRLAGLRGPDRR